MNCNIRVKCATACSLEKLKFKVQAAVSVESSQLLGI